MAEAQEFERSHLIEHLREFKKRVLRILAFFFLAFGFCCFFAEDIYTFLTQPLVKALDGEGGRMIFTDLPEVFFTYVKLAFFGAVFLTFPVIATQIYFFLAPGLYKRERMFLIPVLTAAPFLFVLGASIFFFVLAPMAWHFFLSFENSQIQLQAKVSEYLSLIIQFTLCFGLSFQLPVVMVILAKLGMMSVDFVTRNRRYAVVVVVILAAIFSPADIVSHVALSLMLYGLYEIGIIGAKLVTKDKKE